MPKVFISYRRQDASEAAFNVYRALSEKLGDESVFIDIDTIPFGVDFRQHINSWVSRAEIVLAVIGNHWLDARDEQNKLRLKNPADFVRVEIETAFRLKKCVIPVLVGQATMPSPTVLPKSLRALAYRNAAEVRVGREYDRQLQRLVDWLVNWKPEDGRAAEAAPRPEREGEAEPVPLSRRTWDSGEPEEIITNSIGIKLKLIRAGEFLMGSPDSDAAASDREKPQHKVRITKPFYMGIYPVTQRQYEQIMKDNPSSFRDNLQCPVEGVSWNRAVEFCWKLSEGEGRSYRLPTEAEWEYACRAGTTTKWSCGDDEAGLDRVAWYGPNSGRTTHPVGEKEPNACGLYDMHGNVWEWCQDCLDEKYYANSPPEDPPGPRAGYPERDRVIRGGGWSFGARLCRAAYRGRDGPSSRANDLGFRLARVVS